MAISTQTVSEVQIAKFAISRIGGKNIESFDPVEDSVESHQTALWYHHCRRETLELFDWVFARKRLTLALDSNAAPSGVWVYRYQFPADGIVIRSIQNPAGRNADPVPFDIEVPTTPDVKTILTDVPDAVAIYTANITTPSLYSPSFVNAFSLSLAYKLSYAVRGDEDLKAGVRADYERMLVLAGNMNAGQGRGYPPRDALWIEQR